MFPELTVGTIRFPTSPGDAVEIIGQTDALLVRDRANRIYLNPYDGEVLHIQRAQDLSPAYRWVHTADPLHFGNFGGSVTKLPWCVFGLLLPVMILTGSWLWLRHAKKLEAAVNARGNRGAAIGSQPVQET